MEVDPVLFATALTDDLGADALGVAELAADNARRKLDEWLQIIAEIKRLPKPAAPKTKQRLVEIPKCPVNC